MGATSSAPSWQQSVEEGAPDTVAGWRALGNAFAGLEGLRSVLNERVIDGDAPRIFREQVHAAGRHRRVATEWLMGRRGRYRQDERRSA